MGDEHQQHAHRRKKEDSAAESPSEQAPPPVKLPPAPPENSEQPRIWLLPAAHGKLLAIAEDTDVNSLAQTLRTSPPALLLSETDKGKVFDRTHAEAWRLLEGR